MSRGNGRNGEGGGLLWKLPSLSSKELGKLGPGFGFGAGCGFGFGVGLLGGVGFGPGIPGLQLGFGVGVGCGVGLGFGYGAGKGIAYDETKKYSNVEKPNIPSQDEVDEVVGELIVNTKKIMKEASKVIDKWRQN